ncbi:MAG TPA: flagella basal body P-ring formation protein FlgA [Acidobacteriaceae bacterium]|nr:flagella basal body P-ring formation protein FlgA [Acidobacteriaceae bacterium]
MKLLALTLPMAASLAFAQQHQAMHYPIIETTVANLLHADGTNVTSSQVHLPMQLAAATPDPHLEIVAARKVTEHELDLEVRCQAIRECLPFDALVDTNDANTITALDRSARQPSAHAVPEKVSSPVEPIATMSDHLAAGAQVVLVIADGRMRIHLPAIAVDSGAKGTQIRVCTLDRKKIFHAVVVDGGTVQGVVE